MSKNFELSLVMRLRDMASRGFLATNRDMQAGIARTQQATSNLTRAVTDYARKRDAAAILGIRAERDIQREIQRTEAAYNRLANSGTLSLREQARAAEALKTKLRELNNEAGKYSLGQRMSGAWKAGAGMAAGGAAAGYVLAKPVSQTMDYGMRLAQMANTAYSDRDTAGRIAGKRELNNAIVGAVRQGGGTRESAAETLDSIIASGAMSAKDAMSILPSITKAATASGADATELAQIAIRSMQTFKIKAGDMPGILDMGIAAGQAGGFELKDMAKWLPQQMAMATNLGMSGKQDFARLAAWNQAAVITAGTKDEAGNNLRDLLMEINTPHNKRFLRAVGVADSDKFFLDAQAHGVNKVDAMVDLVKQIVGHDKTYQGLQAKLKGATNNDDKRAILESMTAQVQGGKVGQIFHNQQSLMALLGLMNNQDYVKDTFGKTLAGEGKATAANFSVMSQEEGFKVQQALNEKTFATQTAFEKLMPLVGGVADGFTSMARDFPLLTASAVAATTALTALAAAAGAANLANVVTGGKGGLLTGILSKGRGLLGGLASSAGSALLTGGEAVAGGAAGMAGGALAGGAAGYMGMSAVMESKGGAKFLDGLTNDLARIFAGMGSETAQHIVLQIDGRQVATVVNKRNARDASRH